MIDLFQNLHVAQRGFDHRFGGMAERFFQVRRKRTHVDADADRNALGFRRFHHFGGLFRIADVARIQTKLATPASMAASAMR